MAEAFYPEVAAVLQWFDFRHRPPHLAHESRMFATQAMSMATTMPATPELVVALRKLLESKDAAVRARKGGDAATICAELRAALGM